jgi:lysozyme family protein
MTDKFNKSLNIILAAEGGYTEGKNDPGGETNFGISKRQYPDVDIKNLTRDQAAAIYERDYWTPVKGDELPWPLCVYVFDAAVNQGVQPAIKMLQHTLNVIQDGILGKATLHHALESGSWHRARYLALRGMRYTGTRNFDKFGEGWFIRLFELAGKAS